MWFDKLTMSGERVLTLSGWRLGMSGGLAMSMSKGGPLMWFDELTMSGERVLTLSGIRRRRGHAARGRGRWALPGRRAS